MTSPAGEIKAAAAKIRDVAGRATPGPWLNLDDGDRIIRDTPSARSWMDGVGDDPPQYVIDEPLVENPDNGAHFVLWNPVVALAVADLLDEHALEWQDLHRHNTKTTAGREYPSEPEQSMQLSLSLARAINEAGEAK